MRLQELVAALVIASVGPDLLSLDVVECPENAFGTARALATLPAGQDFVLLKVCDQSAAFQ